MCSSHSGFKSIQLSLEALLLEFFFYRGCEVSPFKRLLSISLVWMVAVIYCSRGAGGWAEPDGGSRAGIVWLYFCTWGGSGDASANFIDVTDNHPNKAGHVIPSTWTDDFFFYSFRAINISTFSISLQFQKQSTMNIYLCTQLKSSIHSF